MPNHYDPTLEDILRVDMELYSIYMGCIWDFIGFNRHQNHKNDDNGAKILKKLEYKRFLVILWSRNVMIMNNL